MYLFFDIECASVNKTVAKICVFGYCLADENFKVIEIEDLLINPRSQGRKRVGIALFVRNVQKTARFSRIRR